jgi:hypothetical protein
VHAVVLSAQALRQAFNNELRALMDMDVDSDSPFPALPAAAHAHPANMRCTEMAHAADTGKSVRFVARCTKYMAVMMMTTMLPALESIQASLNSMEQSLARLSAVAPAAAAGGGGAGKGRLPSASLGPMQGLLRPIV